MSQENLEADGAHFLAQLRSSVGKPGSASTARDPVNQAMIRHWCDAMQDHNPAYTDPEFAATSAFGGIVAPPAMLNAWNMPGLVPRSADRAEDPSSSTYARLDSAGYTSVVATNSEHEYLRYLHLGDRLHATGSVTEVSEEKKTALGIGHFVTTLTEYTTDSGEVVGRMKFRILKFKPGTGRSAPSSEGQPAERPRKPRPGISRDTRFFWEGLDRDELRIQRCEGCGAHHHPPMVRCAKCGSYEFGHTVSSGRGEVYSFVEVCHPKVPAFDYPLVVGLVELEEGTRLLTNIIDIDPERVEVGMPVDLCIDHSDPELSLPLFRPRRPARRETTLRASEIEIGQRLAPCPIPITPTLIVATAIASRDYQDVHHDRDLASQRGSPDIFMNILTSSGLCARFVSDWAGPEAMLRNLRIQLGVPNYPYDTMTMEGEVTALESADGRAVAQLRLRGTNRLGNHVTGTIELELPA